MSEERFQKLIGSDDFDEDERLMLHRYFVNSGEKLPDTPKDWIGIWGQAIVKFNRALRRMRT